METSGSDTVSPKLQRIAELARAAPEMVFTTLAHHIDVDFLREAYRSVRHDGATGVDNETAEDFGKDLEERLQTLLEKLKSGSYRAPPVRRVRIPKDGGKTRPIGIPTFEDKVLQKAVTMVLEAIYEQDFLDCSYGFRPGRSAHQALQTFWEKAMKMGGGWVIDLDIQAFFDNLDHGHLRSFLDQRVRDGVLRRAIGKWLKAGVMEHGSVSYPDAGSPQGGVISPLLANLYLHEVLDKWFERTVKPRLWGVAFLIRYADDAIIMCANAHDANRVMRVLPKRFGRFGLTLHPDKTRLVDFGWPLYPRGGSSAGGPRPGTFDFLGFTHFWGKSRKGRWIIKRKTAKTRFSRAVTRIAHWCRRARHQPIRAQQQTLNRKLQVDHQAQNGQDALQPGGHSHRPLVSASPAPADTRSTANSEPQAAGPRCLLRHHWELPGARAVAVRSTEGLAEMAGPSWRQETDDVGSVPTAGTAVPPRVSGLRPLQPARTRSEAVI